MKCWGRISAWGLSSFGSNDNLGDDLSELGDALPYVDVGTNVGVEQVSCGNDHVCMKLDTGDMKCLGNNTYGQTGIGENVKMVGVITGYIGDNIPKANLGFGLKVLGVYSGDIHTCVKVTGNKVKCFGYNRFGQLGYDDTKTRGTYTMDLGENLPFVNIGTGVEVDSMYAAHSFEQSCAILSKPTNIAQRVKCWGFGYTYVIQWNNATYKNDDIKLCGMGDSLPLIDFGAESRVKKVVSGFLYTCILLINDVLKCGGNTYFGEVGSGAHEYVILRNDSASTVLIDSGKKVKMLTASTSHTCIVYDDMISMKCFGLNVYGQLGQGDTNNRGNTPATIIPSISNIDLGTGTLTISSIYSGRNFNCVLFNDNRVKCFGDNSRGQLGIGSNKTIGDEPGEMGTNLNFTYLVPPSPFDTTALAIGLGVSLPLVLIIVAVAIWLRRRSKANQPRDVETAVVVEIDHVPNGNVPVASVSPPSSLTSSPQSNSAIAGSPVLQKKNLAFVSHAKSETGIFVSLMMNETGKQLKKRKIKKLGLLVENDNITNFTELSNQIKQSKVMVAMLSKSYLTRPSCLTELHFAFEYGIPIVGVNVIGAGYDLNETMNFLRNLSEESLDNINPGASRDLANASIDIRQLGQRLVGVLPNMTIRKYDPTESSRVRDAQLDDVFDAIIANTNASKRL